MVEEIIIQELRLENIDKTKNYFFEERKRNELVGGN